MKKPAHSEIYDFYRGKKVLVTGHTGFKGTWLTQWLIELGAHVSGYALPPHTSPSLFDLLDIEQDIDHEIGEISDIDQLKACLLRLKPDIIFHLAAQSLVGKSYEEPLDTALTNTFGTINLMEAVRQIGLPVSIVLITSDKCYENKEWLFGYRETDTLGGHDPYSASKAAAEIMINSWRNSFFSSAAIDKHGVRLASARAGNVIGGGDWNKDRIVPDCIRDLQNHKFISVRNPHATRPWQHVLEPLSGYLLLGKKLLETPAEKVTDFCAPFNFGPHVTNNRNVRALVEEIIAKWGSGSWQWISPENAKYESSLLNLSIDKAYHKLGWLPKWNFSETISRTVEWYQRLRELPSSIRDFTVAQIRDHQASPPFASPNLVEQKETLSSIA